MGKTLMCLECGGTGSDEIGLTCIECKGTGTWSLPDVSTKKAVVVSSGPGSTWSLSLFRTSEPCVRAICCPCTLTSELNEKLFEEEKAKIPAGAVGGLLCGCHVCAPFFMANTVPATAEHFEVDEPSALKAFFCTLCPVTMPFYLAQVAGEWEARDEAAIAAAEAADAAAAEAADTEK